MTISVLMSVYKSEEPAFLDRSLSSISIEQTIKPDEIILIEDGKLTDELYHVIEKWKQQLGEKLLLLENEKNIGLTKSLNRGLEFIKSDLIARMDSDDISCPDRFEKQAAYLSTHSDIDVLGGAIYEIDENENIINKRYYPTNQKAILKSIFRANPIAHSSAMIRTSLFKKGLRYNEKYRTNQDLALWFDAICEGHKLANLPDIILLFRRESGVYQRRRRKHNLWVEFKIYCIGIKRIYGLFSLKYVYPIMRFCLKLMPTKIVRMAYMSNIRKIVTEHEVNYKRHQ